MYKIVDEEKYTNFFKGITDELRTRYGEINAEATKDDINKWHTFGRSAGIAEALLLIIERARKEAPELLK